MGLEEAYEIALAELLCLTRGYDARVTREFVERLAGEYLITFAHDFCLRQDYLSMIIKNNYASLKASSGTNTLPFDFLNPRSPFGHVYCGKAEPPSNDRWITEGVKALAAFFSAAIKRSRKSSVFYHASIQGHEGVVPPAKLLKSLGRRVFYRENISSRRFPSEIGKRKEDICRACLRVSAPTALIEQLSISIKLSALYPKGVKIYHSFGPSSDAALGYARAAGRIEAVETTHGGVFHEIANSPTDAVLRRINHEYLSWLVTDARFPCLRFWSKRLCSSKDAVKLLHIQGSFGSFVPEKDFMSPLSAEKLRLHTVRLRELTQKHGFSFKPHPRAVSEDTISYNVIDSRTRAEDIISKETLVVLDEPHSTIFYFLLLHEVPCALVLPDEDVFRFSVEYEDIIRQLRIAGLVLTADSFEELIDSTFFQCGKWWKKVSENTNYKLVRERFIRPVEFF